jgi:hypothetical protein
VKFRRKKLDGTLETRTALFGLDFGLIGRQQALTHLNADITPQACLTVAAEFTRIAGDVDSRIVGVGLEQFLEPGVLARSGPAGRITRQRRANCDASGQQRSAEPSENQQVSRGRLHSADYNCAGL